MKIAKSLTGCLLIVLLAAAGCASPAQRQAVETGNLAARLPELLEGVTAAIGGVSDADQARAAKHTLMELEAQLADLAAQAADAPETTQREIAKTTAAALPGIDAAAKQALGIPGVPEVLGPSVANLNGILKELLRQDS